MRWKVWECYDVVHTPLVKKDVTSMCKICHVYVEGTAALFFSFCKCGWW